DLLREEMPRLGFECVTPIGTTSPVITFSMDEGARVREQFNRAGIDASVYPNHLRLSPSIYNDLTDIEWVLESLS
ncbi:MAG: hypothetical protein VX507_01825, partial [Gemmatimonadota bacterium]|nr:hypothetical protein [Gemmatimonadota bacterium]